MKIHFVHTVDPPKVLNKKAPLMGKIAALVLVVLVTIHLVRIDSFVQILDTVLPGGSGWAGYVAASILLSELFAIPFLLRLRLSFAANIFSGAFAVLAPLWWVLISIWSLGLADSTGELGQFIVTTSTLWLVTANIVWLSYNFLTLSLLGYNSLNIKDIAKSIRKKE